VPHCAGPSVDGSCDLKLNIQSVDLWRRLGVDESGATAVEYALLLGGVAAAIIVMIYVFGGKVNNLYNSAASAWP
jgi:Flp pilus assembly pilin Flp